MSVKETIIQYLEPLLDTEKYFVVDILVSPSKINQKITILIDTDEGISIDDCAVISRKLGNLLEENEAIENAYRLEVSSPGVDYPLSTERQFRKNIGRKLKVTFKDGRTEQIGTIQTVSEDAIVLVSDKKSKSKAEPVEPEPIKIVDISKAQIQISFN